MAVRMAETIAHFAVKSIGLSRVNGRKPCTLMEAARHNLREIQAELGSVGRINPMRSASNSVLRGSASAAEVQALAVALLAAQGINPDKLRKDHCQAIECVFSLPPDAIVTDRAAYFARCLKWVAGAMHLPVLSAVVHRDESAQHLHVLLVPLKDRAHVGSSAIDRIALKRLRNSFFTQVAGPAGLKCTGAKVRGVVKQWAVAAVLRRAEAMGLSVANGLLWPVLVAAIERDPTAAMLALGININDIRPCAAESETNPIGVEANPIGIEKLGPKDRTLSCVGIATPAPSPEPQKAIGSLSRKSTPTAPPADRLRIAQEAQQVGIDRHARRAPAPAPTAPSVIDSSVTRVERDEHTHDTSVWD